jgi:hypothetical protein
MPLIPQAGNGVFTAALATINFSARPQRPFRGERLIAQVIRTGASAAAAFAVTTGIFVGVTLQQLQIGNFNIEFFTANAFGVRLSMSPAEPGVDITMPVSLTAALAGADTLAVQLILLGSSIR